MLLTPICELQLQREKSLFKTKIAAQRYILYKRYGQKQQLRYNNNKQSNMILYALVARSKDGTILVESTIAGVSGGNFPQISVEVLQKVVSTSNYNSAVLGTLQSSASNAMLPNGTRRTFVQRSGGDGFFCAEVS